MSEKQPRPHNESAAEIERLITELTQKLQNLKPGDVIRYASGAQVEVETVVPGEESWHDGAVAGIRTDSVGNQYKVDYDMRTLRSSIGGSIISIEQE